MKILLLGLLLAVSACSLAPNGERPSDAEVSLVKGDAAVGTYVSSWKGFRTSSYWIEGPEGLVIIDTQFLPSAAEEMVNWAEKTTGKKAVLAIVLHPNPDKFNGTAAYLKRGIRVLTSEQVRAQIPTVHELRKEWFFERFKPDYPVEYTLPESFGPVTTTIKVAGLELKLHVLGAGCSSDHVVVQWRGNVFVGDLVTIGFHSWLELGRLTEWLTRLDEIEAMNPDYIRTGRGGSGDIDTLARQKRYLNDVIKIVTSFDVRGKTAPPHNFTEEAMAKVVAAYPAYEYTLFAENGLEKVWTDLARRINSPVKTQSQRP